MIRCGNLSLSRGFGGGSILLSGSGGLLVLVGGGVDIVILLSGAVNGDLDGNGTTINLLAVHLANSLGLELLVGKADKTEAAGLAALVASLELLDHEAGNGAQGNLGTDGLVGGEDLLELWKWLATSDAEYEGPVQSRRTLSSVRS